MKSSQQLEREAEETRRHLESTLDELRSRLTPGEVVDQVFDYARDGKAGVFFNNLGRQALNNPLPVALVGAGIAWLMLSNGHGSAASGSYMPRRRQPVGSAREVASSITEAGSNIADRASEAGGAVVGAVHATADAIGAAARSTSESLRHSATAVSETVSSTASHISEAASKFRRASDRAGHTVERMKDSSSELSRHATESAQNFVAFCKEQPLVLAGIGLALGAAIGAAFPATRAENKMFGAASDGIKEKLGQVKDQVTDSVSDMASTITHAGSSEESTTRQENGVEGTGDSKAEDRHANAS
jgi:ElaB/YqjD/DUF883 family membrane-anchored ribosome-binding protein